MTEEEAKEKWCPMTLSVNERFSVACIASECMAWVWDMEPTVKTIDGVDFDDMQLSSTIGHCGMVK